MDRNFSNQLANLQRAASRAGRDDDNNNGGRGSSPNNRRENNNSSYQQHHRGRDGGYNGGRRDDRHYDNDRSYHNQSRKRGRDGDMRDGDMRDGRRSYNNTYDRDNRYGSNRYDSSRGRGGDGRYGGGGRRRNDYGRNNNNNNNNNQERYNSAEQSTSLAELVNNVKSSYQESMNVTKNTKESSKQRHIALLFLTIDGLPHEHIWKEWLKSSSSCTDGDASKHDKPSSSDIETSPIVSVLCHAKYPDRIKSEWLRQRHLLQQSRKNDDDNDSLPKFHSHRPEWGSVEITRAMIDLLEEALRIGTDDSMNSAKYLSTPIDTGAQQNKQNIPPVDRFIFVSESCLPVTTLEEVELALFGPRNASESSVALYDKSWVNARSTPNNGYSRQLQWDAIRTDNIPHNFIWKADQWMVLNRSHADAVASLPAKHLNGRQLWPAFRKCRASDEIYFPTVLSILGIISRQDRKAQVDDTSKGESCAGGEIRRRKITYCDWSQGAKNPASFTSRDWKGVVVKARGDGCLFARKFVLLSSLPGGVYKNPHTIDNNGTVSVDDWITVVKQKQFG